MIPIQRFSAQMWLAVVIILLIALSGCQAAAESAPAGKLSLAGSTTIEPAAKLVAEAFMDRYPQVEVKVEGGGSSIGIKSAAYGSSDIGMVSRDIREEELAEWPTLQTTQIGSDGVAVVVNRALYGAGVTQLSLEQAADIWLGKITNWQELGGPDLSIKAYDREMGRGERDTFGKAMLGDEEASAPGVVGALGDNSLVLAAISEERNAVSILAVGALTDEVVGLAIVLPDGQVVEPTAANVANGSYPIVRKLHFITDGPPQGLAAQFIEFTLSAENEALVEKAGYVPVKTE